MGAIPGSERKLSYVSTHHELGPNVSEGGVLKKTPNEGSSTPLNKH